jgi:DNA-directed RNA polymerase specialized sigma subunit
MIRNDNELKEAVARLREEAQRLDAYHAKLAEQKLGEAEIERALDPLRSFHLQLAEEVESYERLRKGEIDELRNLRGLGHFLISLRIARGLTQRELAERLGVSESQVSRDERNEYHGITIERAARVLDALAVGIRIAFEPEPAAA